MNNSPPDMTSTAPLQPPLRLRVHLPTRQSFLANGVHQLELILQYGDLEEHVLMIDIHGNIGLPSQPQEDDQVIKISDSQLSIYSSPNSSPSPTSKNGEQRSGESVGDHPLLSSRSNITSRKINRKCKKVCKICHKKFANKYSAARHSAVHFNPEKKAAIKQGWKNKCYFCSKGFPSQSNLYCHLSIHTNEKAHPCENCKKRFNRKCNLSTHQRLHKSNQATRRPFHCTECDSSFTQPHGLTRHVKTVHRELKPHQCPECDLKTGEKATMLKHLNAVHYGICYPCRKINCGKTFSTKDSLRRHEKTAH